MSDASLLLLASLVSGARAGTLEGRAVTAGRCSSDAAAECWSVATRLTRFASEPGELSAPLTADVRLAWSLSGILVRVADLPSGQAVEVTIGGDPDDERLRRVLAGSVHATVAAGVSELPLPEPAAVGQVHAAWVSLVDGAVAEGPRAVATLDAVPVVRPWAPSGPGDLTEPILLGLADQPGAPTVVVTGDRAVARGAALRATVTRPMLPRGARDTSWSAFGAGKVDLTGAPTAEWVGVTARWPDGRVSAVRRPGSPRPVAEALSADIFPAPRVFVPGRGPALVLTDSATVSVDDADWLGAADLLAAEVRRLSGVRVESVVADGVLRITRTGGPGSVALPSAARASLQHPEGFAVRIDQDGAVVFARTLRGASYGALALADALGTDASAPAILVADHPAVARRVLTLPLTVTTGPLNRSRLREFVERVVVRGRFNELVLDLQDGFGWTRHRGLARGGSIGSAAVHELDAVARRLGLVVSPALSVPGGARWLTDSRPELEEDGRNGMVCTRQPSWRPLVTDLLDEALELLPDAPYVDIGHDRVGWATGSVWGTQRCSLCAGSPRHLLITEHAAYVAAHVLEASRDVVIAAEAVLLGGDRAQPWTDAVPPERLTIRADASEAAQLDGYRILETLDGYTSHWKLDADRVAGRDLRLGMANPWRLPAISGPASAPQPHHWTRVLVAGAAAWQPGLSEYDLADILSTVRDAPAFLPGSSAPSSRVQAGSTLELAGPRPVPERGWPTPAEAAAGGLTLADEPAVASLSSSVQADIGADRGGGPVVGAAVLLGAVVDQAAWLRLSLRLSRGATVAGPQVGALVAVLDDGSELRRPLYFGTDLPVLGGAVEAGFPWAASGRWLGPGPDAAAAGADTPDTALARIDWLPGKALAQVRQFRVEVDEPGVEVLVAALAPLERARAR